MIIYTIAILYYFLLISVSSKINSKILLFLLCIPLILFSVFRGISGSDTVNYIYLYRDINEKIAGVFSFSGEPVIYFLMYISRNLFDGGLLTFYTIYATIYGLMLTYILSNYHKYKVFLLTVGAVLVIDGLTNTLRVSVAYLLFLFAVNSRYYYCFMLLSFFTHATAILIAGFKILVDRLKPNFNANFILRIATMLFLMIISMILVDKFSYLVPRIADKINQYQDLEAISTTSGLSDIFVIVSLLTLGSIYNRGTIKEIYSDMIMIFFLTLILFLCGQMSIAAYRIFKIIIIVLTVSPFLTNSKRSIPTIFLLGIGILYTLNFIKIINGSEAYQVYGGELYQLYNMHNLY